jgi:hypothetical protein
MTKSELILKELDDGYNEPERDEYPPYALAPSRRG